MDFTQKALQLCKEVSACDDHLGHYSDYEGDAHGPTFLLWNQGLVEFDIQCKLAIKQHAIAIALWKKFAKLNRMRGIAAELGIQDPSVEDLTVAIKRTRVSWTAAIQRCTNPKNPQHADYGGRGISVCPHWRESFRQFISDMGLRPEGLSLDRIDNNKGYLCPLCCPPKGNCRWENYHTQRTNQRPRKSKERTLTPKGKIMQEWWDKQSPEYKLARNVKARAIAGDALGEWRAKKTTVCLRCDYKWAKTKQKRTRVCPKCLSPNWDVPPAIDALQPDNSSPSLSPSCA